ncbi:uncharacterized protein SAPINGB_P003035 [Magnusiomyces paraingens]|uniref:RING-type domain-containing protein n=1 Tax=Magnusiomyces paraingens TaxID=2606893 RepID=A0A5E8BRA1_9ASCO|nr:uncharacterized protein SAPINGB_P003035 [Saprochaete ingens]VVT51253.1 unnamed protein product [Saprochaete ingens]
MVYSYSIVFETATQLEAIELEHLQKQAKEEKLRATATRDSDITGEDTKTEEISTRAILSVPVDNWCKIAISNKNIFSNFDSVNTTLKKNQPVKITSNNQQHHIHDPELQQHLSLDWRFGKIEISGIDMDKIQASSPPLTTSGNGTPVPETTLLDTQPLAFASLPPSSPPAGSNNAQTTPRPRSKSVIMNARPDLLKARFLGYGVVRLYRGDVDSDEQEYQYSSCTRQPKNKTQAKSVKSEEKGEENISTILAILAVPSYMTPCDFIGFIGPNARENVSHLRMVRTAQPNRYLVLMKFRNTEFAAQFYRDYNGKLFNSMEAETCQIVSVNRIEFRNYNGDETLLREQRKLSKSFSRESSEFPYLMEDPFTQAARNESAIDEEDEEDIYSDPKKEEKSRDGPGGRRSLTQPPANKPAPPPTPILTELPTCPVCLERMDAATTGLLTIPCQHTFHCQCLSKWKDGSCPVCRYSQRGSAKSRGRCAVCQARENLWICLICGHIGCGRYDNAHAFDHYEATGHCYAMDIETQRVWDYLSDGYVHRLLQNQNDGKLVELPGFYPGSSGSSSGEGGSGPPGVSPGEAWGHSDTGAAYDVANAAMKAADNSDKKVSDMSIHFTQLLSSQLESQRDYYESLMAASADKAAAAVSRATKLEQENSKLVEEAEKYGKKRVPELERELEKMRQRAEKLHKLCTKLEGSYREEKLIGEETIKKLKRLEEESAARDAEVDELRETVRDLMFFHEAQAKLQNAGEDIQEGTIIIPENPPMIRKKGKKSR